MKSGCLNASLLTTSFVFSEIAEHLETVLHVFTCAALLDDSLASPFDVLTRYLKAVPVFELSNAEIAALFFHLIHLLS